MNCRPNIAAANISGLLGYVLLVLNEFVFHEAQVSIIYLGIIVGLIYWLLGYTFTSLLLIPLKWLMKYVSKTIAIVLFSGIGFLVPFLLAIPVVWLDAHGSVEPFIGNQRLETFTRISLAGFIGFLSAVAAWRCLTTDAETYDT